MGCWDGPFRHLLVKVTKANLWVGGGGGNHTSCKFGFAVWQLGRPVPQKLMFESSAKGGCGNIFEGLFLLLLNFNKVLGFRAAPFWSLGKTLT